MKTCANCALQALCRVYERFDALEAEPETDAPEAADADDQGGLR